MTSLEDAIKHCEEVAETCKLSGCAEDHRQLASWLTELKARREYHPDTRWAKAFKYGERWRCGYCSTAVGRFWVYCQKCGSKIDWSKRDNDGQN